MGMIYGKGKFRVWSGTDDRDRDSSSTGLRSSLGSSLGSSFQRQGDAWRKERLLTFKEEYKGGRAR